MSALELAADRAELLEGQHAHGRVRRVAKAISAAEGGRRSVRRVEGSLWASFQRRLEQSGAASALGWLERMERGYAPAGVDSVAAAVEPKPAPAPVVEPAPVKADPGVGRITWFARPVRAPGTNLILRGQDLAMGPVPEWVVALLEDAG